MADPVLPLLALLVVLALAALVILLLVLRSLRATGVNESALSASVVSSLNQSGLYRELGEVKTLAQQMARTTENLQRVFTVTQQRGSLGEQQLEAILRDVVPPDRLAIRTQAPGLGIPDAAIRSRDRLVCIDSKFPLDKYREMVAGADSEREGRGRGFLRDVRGHLDKVAQTYVRPEAGSAPFAIAFIPSEAVYTFIHQADPGLGREYSRKGVLLASPSTLTTHAALLVMGIEAEVLSERAEFVQKALQRLERELVALREAWALLRKHVKNANEQGVEVDRALQALEGAFKAARGLERQRTLEE